MCVPFIVQFDFNFIPLLFQFHEKKYSRILLYFCKRFHEKKIISDPNNILGGSNGRGAILDVTRGHFEDGFTGCLRNIVIQNIQVFTAQMEEISGKNIRTCSS